VLGKLGIAAAVGVLAVTALPGTSSKAAPAVVHYTIQATNDGCGPTPTHTCYPGGNVNLFPSGADDSVAQVGLPWPVYIYGTSYNKAWVSSNGNVQFGATSSTAQTTFINTSLPSSSLSVKAAVAPYWADLLFNVSATPVQGVFYRSTTFNSKAAFVISWRGTEYSTGFLVRAEVIFYKNSRNITFQYVQGAAQSATIGIQKSPFGPAVKWSFDTSSTFTNLELTFIPS
jgi:hypothetical protein